MTPFRTLVLSLIIAVASIITTACASQEVQQEVKQDSAAAATSSDVKELFTVFHEKDGRFYVFGDRKVYNDFLAGHEPAYILSRIAGGPQRQTLTFGMTKDDSKTKIEEIGYMNLYYDKAQPAADFYGESVKGGRFYVFDDWHDMKEFNASGEAPYIFTYIGKGPNRETVTLVRNKKTKDDTAKADILMAKFREVHGLQ